MNELVDGWMDGGNQKKTTIGKKGKRGTEKRESKGNGLLPSKGRWEERTAIDWTAERRERNNDTARTHKQSSERTKTTSSFEKYIIGEGVLFVPPHSLIHYPLLDE